MRTIVFLCFNLLVFVANSQRSETFLKGAAFFNNEQYKKAEVLFRKDLKETGDIASRIYLSRCLFLTENYTECLAVSEPLRSHSEEKIRYDITTLRAVAFIRTNELDSAMKLCDLAISMRPKDVLNYSNKAVVYYKQMKFQESKAMYIQAYELDTTNAESLLNWVEACYPTRDYQEALTGLFKLRKLKPKLAIEMNFGYLYSMMENYQAADSVYQLVLNLEDAYFLNNYGFNKFKLGQVSEGKELIQKSLKINKTNSYAYRNLALIAIAEGDTKQICANLLKAKKYGYAKAYGSEVDDLLAQYCK